MKRARICILLAITLILVLGFGSTALASEGEGGDIGAQSIGPPPKPTMSVTGSGKSETIYDWMIEKAADKSGITLPLEASETVAYTISLEKGKGRTVNTVSGTLSLTVYSDTGFKVHSISAWVEKDPPGPGSWSEVPGTKQTLVGETTYQKGSHTIQYSANVPDASGPFRVKFKVDIVQNPDDPEPVSNGFQLAPSTVNDKITVSDVASATGVPDAISIVPDANYLGTWSNIQSDRTITYTVTFTNTGNTTGGSGPYDNEATIVETEQSATASVQVDVPQPQPTPEPTPDPNPPEPRDERKVRWPDRTPPPEEVAADAVPLPRTGGLIEWEWVALVGGMLTSGGGALYLVRRRKFKK